MNKTKIAVSVTLIGATYAAYQWHTIRMDLAKRFPQIDTKIRMKAFRKFLKNSRANVYGNMDSFSDEYMDQLFLEIVREMTTSK